MPMLLPTKHLHPQKSLVSISGRILRYLSKNSTLVELWESYQSDASPNERVTFDWFVLALDVLFAFDVVTIKRGVICKRQ